MTHSDHIVPEKEGYYWWERRVGGWSRIPAGEHVVWFEPESEQVPAHIQVRASMVHSQARVAMIMLEMATDPIFGRFLHKEPLTPPGE